MRALITVVMLLGITACVCADTNVATQVYRLGSDDIALLDTMGAIDDLLLVAPAEAGLPPVVDTSTGRLVYTSIVPPSGGSPAQRDISARISASVFPGLTPAGTTLYLTAADPGIDTPGQGEGDRGTTAGRKALNGTDKPVLQSIGSCYTRQTSGSGTALLYELVITDWSAVRSAPAGSITVTLTLGPGL